MVQVEQDIKIRFFKCEAGNNTCQTEIPLPQTAGHSACDRAKPTAQIKAALFLILAALLLIVLSVLPHGGLQAKADSSMKSMDSLRTDMNYGSSAECMATIESSTNRVLYSKNMHAPRPMASVTKILTAITVLENCENLDERQKIPKSAVGIEGSSIYLSEGEEISTRDLLYGLMLQSGNDCATALAFFNAGSIENFSAKMNETAVKAGAKNSNFVNPHGLHDDKHYTTAYDLAVITSYAMKNPIFREIASSKSRKIDRTRQDVPTLILNKNKLLSGFDGADGVKTGFTKRAGRCLVSSATREGMQVITVVLNCGPMFEECSRLMNCAFNEFSLVCIATAGESLVEIPLVDGEKSAVRCGVKTNIYYPLRANETVKTAFELIPAGKMKNADIFRNDRTNKAGCRCKDEQPDIHIKNMTNSTDIEIDSENDIPNNGCKCAQDNKSKLNRGFTADVDYAKTLFAPLKKDTKVGIISFTLDNRLLFSRGLFTIEDAPAMPYSDFLDRIIGEW